MKKSKSAKNGSAKNGTSDLLLKERVLSKDMWINPRTSLRGADGDRAWDHRHGGNPINGARFLELADLALGLKKPEARRKKGAAAGTHQTSEKTEPYTH